MMTKNEEWNTFPNPKPIQFDLKSIKELNTATSPHEIKQNIIAANSDGILCKKTIFLNPIPIKCESTNYKNSIIPTKKKKHYKIQQANGDAMAESYQPYEDVNRPCLWTAAPPRPHPTFWRTPTPRRQTSPPPCPRTPGPAPSTRSLPSPPMRASSSMPPRSPAAAASSPQSRRCRRRRRGSAPAKKSGRRRAPPAGRRRQAGEGGTWSATFAPPLWLQRRFWGERMTVVIVDSCWDSCLVMICWKFFFLKKELLIKKLSFFILLNVNGIKINYKKIFFNDN